MGALLFQGLRTEIGALCAGWETKNRHVRIFVDELTDITGADGRDSGGNVDAVEWLRSRARAYGAELTVGTRLHHRVPHDRQLRAARPHVRADHGGRVGRADSRHPLPAQPCGLLADH